MKKIIAVLLGLMFLLSAFAIAEGQGSAGETGDSEDVDDSSDAVENEAVEYEQEETGEATVSEIEQEAEITDQQLEQELGISAEESAEISEADKRIGIRNYILNRQLKHRTFVAIVHGKAIIQFMENKNISTGTLPDILAQLNATYAGIDPKTMTKEQRNETTAKVKELVQQFKETAKSLIPPDAIPSLRKKIQEFELKEKAKIDELLRWEYKARMLYNKRQFRNAYKELRDDAKELIKDGRKLLAAGAKIKALKQIRDKYKDGNLNATELKELRSKWKEQVQQYNEERNNSVIKNERALLAIEIAKVRKAIKEAKEAGEDTSQLEAQLAELNKQLEQFVPGKIVSADAKAKAAILKAKIKNVVQSSPKIKERVEKIKDLRKEIRETKKEIRNETKSLINAIRAQKGGGNSGSGQNSSEGDGQ
jgi:hypothetical protein